MCQDCDRYLSTSVSMKKSVHSDSALLHAENQHSALQPCPTPSKHDVGVLVVTLRHRVSRTQYTHALVGERQIRAERTAKPPPPSAVSVLQQLERGHRCDVHVFEHALPACMCVCVCERDYAHAGLRQPHQGPDQGQTPVPPNPQVSSASRTLAMRATIPA